MACTVFMRGEEPLTIGEADSWQWGHAFLDLYSGEELVTQVPREIVTGVYRAAGTNADEAPDKEPMGFQ